VTQRENGGNFQTLSITDKELIFDKVVLINKEPNRGRKEKGAGVMKDKKLKLEEEEDSLSLGGSGKCRVQGKVVCGTGRQEVSVL
jgi:hypothetical protein